MEAAITLPVLCFVLFALLDLGIAATRYNALAEISRRIAREAILHGAHAPTGLNVWGTAPYSGTMADNSEVVDQAADRVLLMQASDVNVSVTWPDNDNSPRDRVAVEVNYEHIPLVPGICPWGNLNLRSTSTMHIVN